MRADAAGSFYREGEHCVVHAVWCRQLEYGCSSIMGSMAMAQSGGQAGPTAAGAFVAANKVLLDGIG